MKTLILSIFCFWINIGLSQNIAIENTRAMNIIYSWKNPITIVVENIPCSNLFIKTNNGKIEGNNCNYFITPEKIGRAIISVHQINDSDTLLIAEKKFRVKRFPLSKPYVGNKNSGLISLAYLQAQLGILVRIENFDISAKVKVNSYRVSIIRKNEMIEQYEIKGAKFTLEVREHFKRLQASDKILIDKVYVRTPGIKKYLEVESTELTIE